jgi:SagB-type dehydrogenase family enzyme
MAGKDIVRGREFLRPDWGTIDFSTTDQGKGLPPPPQEKAFDSGRPLVKLVPAEKWKLGKVLLVDAILGRKSRRKYSDASLSLAELSFLLFATQGIKDHREKFSFRTVPSGGARHSFETYLFANRVKGLEKGLYRYLPVENALYPEFPCTEGTEERLNDALNGQYWNPAAYFVWTSLPYRMEWRYGSLSHKIIGIDAGHVCQNLYLACEAIGCGTCGIGAYRQQLLDAFLGVDGDEEFAVYAAPVGKIERAGRP